MKVCKETRNQFLMLVGALLILGGSLTYRSLYKQKVHSEGEVTEEKSSCSDGCGSEMKPGAEVEISEVIKQEYEVVNALAIKFEEISGDRNIELHGQGVMDIVAMWLEIKRVKNQFTLEEQSVEMNKQKSVIQKALARLKKASAPIPLFDGGKHLMLQVGTALNAVSEAGETMPLSTEQ